MCIHMQAPSTGFLEGFSRLEGRQRCKGQASGSKGRRHFACGLCRAGWRGRALHRGCYTTSQKTLRITFRAASCATASALAVAF